MAALVPDLTGSAFTRRISNHICSGHLHLEGFKTGFEDSFKLSITNPDKTYSPFLVPLSSIPSDVVGQQGFDFLRDSIAFNASHRIGPPPRDATHSPEVALNALPDASPIIEDLQAALDRERKAHRNTKAQLEALEAQREPEDSKASIPVFQSRVGFSTANANVKANRPERPVFDDDPSSDSSDAPDPPQPSPKKVDPSGSETEPEEDEDAAMEEEFSQKTLQGSQAQPSSTLPKSPSKPPTPSKRNPSSSQMLPPPTSSARSKSGFQQNPKSSPVASGSKLSPSKISPRRKLLREEPSGNNNSSDESTDDSPSLTASNRKEVKKSGSSFIKPLPPPKKKTGRAAAKKRGTFGEESSSSSEGKSTKPAAKKAKSRPSSSPAIASSSKGKGKSKMVVEEKSGSDTE
ncbi:hypothetical protein BDY24DRAFT_378144 [Mrakia frigida]|uniref:uncharacterized protein n=1 Tax=Mrakia frigida TaxID=29902 RepID=UPI003FCC09F9